MTAARSASGTGGTAGGPGSVPGAGLSEELNARCRRTPSGSRPRHHRQVAAAGRVGAGHSFVRGLRQAERRLIAVRRAYRGGHTGAVQHAQEHEPGLGREPHVAPRVVADGRALGFHPRLERHVRPVRPRGHRGAGHHRAGVEAGQRRAADPGLRPYRGAAVLAQGQAAFGHPVADLRVLTVTAVHGDPRLHPARMGMPGPLRQSPAVLLLQIRQQPLDQVVEHLPRLRPGEQVPHPAGQLPQPRVPARHQIIHRLKCRARSNDGSTHIVT